MKSNAIVFALLILLAWACKNQQSDAVKYADAPASQIPSGAMSTPSASGTGPDFDEFNKKKETGCATTDEVKEQQAKAAALGQPATLQGKKDGDCTVQ